MSDPLRRHKYAFNRVLIPAARILSPEFNAAYLFFTGSQIEILRNLVIYATRETTFVDEYHTDYYITPDDDDLDSVAAIVADLEDVLMTTALGSPDAYVCVRDKKTANTPGGTFTAAGWRTRDLNDELADDAEIASIDSNQLTLAEGTYRCLIQCPCYRTNRTQALLYNITDSAIELVGNPGFFVGGDNDWGHSLIAGRFTLDDEKVLEVQHRCTRTQSTDGFGVECNFTDEIYTVAEFWRET